MTKELDEMADTSAGNLSRNDHDLLIRINTLLDVYIGQQKEFNKTYREEMNRLWEEKATQIALTANISKTEHLDQVKVSKSDFNGFKNDCDKDYKELKTADNDLGKRVRTLEIRAAIAVGILLVLNLAAPFVLPHLFK